MKDFINSLELSDEIKASLVAEADKFKSQIVESTQNDATFVKSLRSQGRAEAWATAEKSLKKVSGVDLDSIDKELKGGERLKAAFEMGINSVKENGNKTNQQLQEQIQGYHNEIQNFKDEVIPGINADWEVKFNRNNIETSIKDHIIKNDKIQNKEAAFIFTDAYLSRNQYDTKWSDGLVIEKDGLKPQIGEKVVTEADFINHVADIGGYIVHSNGTTTEKKTTQGQTTTNNGEESEAVRKMRERFESARA